MASREEVTALYREILGRDPDAGGMATYLQHDTGTIRDALINSQEYKNRTIQANVNEGFSKYDDWISKGNNSSTEFHASSAGEIIAVNPNQAMGGEYKYIGDSNGRKLYVDEGDGGDGGFLGGLGATIGSVAGTIIGSIIAPGFGTIIGGAIGGAIGGGAEEYEMNHDWADTGQSALYGGAQGALSGYSAGLTNYFAAGAVAGGGTTLLQKAQGGSWEDAAMQGAVAGVGAGLGSWYNGGTYNSAIDWTAPFSSPVSSVADQTTLASANNAKVTQTSGLSADGYAGAGGDISGSSASAVVGRPWYEGVTPFNNRLMSEGAIISGNSSASTPALAEAAAIATGEGASTGLFGTGYNAMEMLTASTIALQGIGTVLNYMQQPEEISPEEAGRDKAAAEIAYWDMLAKAGYGNTTAMPSTVTEDRSPTTPGSVYKSGSITK